VSAEDEGEGPPPPDEEPPADEEYARAWAAGYEEGARTALREVVQHAARGHTPQEIRMLAEGRLVRLPEEVELKRRGLLTPPRRTAWGALLRPTPAGPTVRPWSAPVGGSPPRPPIAAGQAVLVREERPARALEMLRTSARAFPRIAVVSLHPPPLPGVLPAQRVDIAPVGPAAADGAPGRVGLSELGGRLKGPTEAPGGALVYLDAIEYYVTEEGAETTIRFLHWLIGQVRATGSALLATFDARTLDPKEAARFERAFPTTL
jgi:hypothetical protein